MADETSASSGLKVGSIFYEVTLDTSKMIDGQRQAAAVVNRLETSLTSVAMATKTLVVQTQLEAAAQREAAAASDAAAKAAAKKAAALEKAAEREKKAAENTLKAATRNLPAQVTDIVTGIQAGQSPLTVLLQQGGQLKDMFGGVLPAAKALGGYLAGLVNVWTGLAAAAALLVVGFVKGDQEMVSFNRNVILTGGAAGKTAIQLNEMAAGLAKIPGLTRGQAAEALNTFVEAGVRAGDSLGRFTKAALLLERAGGPAIAETAKAFKDLEKAPLQASLKLNESTNFLTTSLYRQIKSLEEQGRVTEAARVAQEAYAKAILERAPMVEQNLGAIERAWKTVATAAKKGWDAILNIGRTDTPEQVLASTKQRIADIQRQLETGGFATTAGGAAVGRGLQPGERAKLEQELAAKQEVVRLSEKAAQAAAAQADEAARTAEQTRALEAFDRIREKYISEEKREQMEIAAAKNLGKAAGLDEQEIRKVTAEIEKRAIERRLAAESYYQGILAESLTALEKINAEQTRAEGDNARRMSADKANRETYEKAKVAIVAKYDRQRAMLAEKTAQEMAEASIAITLDETTKINAIREEEFRRAEALQKLGVLTVQQAEAEKAKAVFKAVQDLQTLQSRRQGAQVDTLRMRASTSSGNPQAQEDLIRAQAAQALAENEQMRLRDLEGAQIYADRRVAIEEEMNARIAAMRAESNANALSSASAGFGALTDVLRDRVGEQDGVYKAMFAAQKAFAIASAAVNIHKAISDAAADGKTWQEKLVAMGTIASATAGILANIKGVNYGGGRQYGGPVSAGSMYRVNETGRPEMFTAANGSQYMLPTASGNVTPANAVGQGGGVEVHIHNYGGEKVSQQKSDDGKRVDVFIGEASRQIQENSGQLWNAFRSSTNIQGRL